MAAKREWIVACSTQLPKLLAEGWNTSPQQVGTRVCMRWHRVTLWREVREEKEMKETDIAVINGLTLRRFVRRLSLTAVGCALVAAGIVRLSGCSDDAGAQQKALATQYGGLRAAAEKRANCIVEAIVLESMTDRIAEDWASTTTPDAKRRQQQRDICAQFKRVRDECLTGRVPDDDIARVERDLCPQETAV